MSKSEFTAVILAATCGSRLYPLTISGDDDDGGNDEFNDYFEEEEDAKDSNPNTKAISESEPAPTVSTSSYLPKHLLPLAGRPLLHHLLEKLVSSNMQNVIIAISSIDQVTIPSLVNDLGVKKLNTSNDDGVVQSFELSSSNGVVAAANATSTKTKTSMKSKTTSKMMIQVVSLQSDCIGSADALRFITSIQNNNSNGDSLHNEKMEEQIMNTTKNEDEINENKNEMKSNNNDNYDNGLIPTGSHVMVMSADLVLYGDLCCERNENKEQKEKSVVVKDDVEDTFSSLANVHRANYHLGLIGEGPPLAMTVVLSDVGECDANGVPLKESAKAKKGGLSREDEDIEYIALSEINVGTNNTPQSSSSSTQQHRIILKQAKFNVEEDEGNTGETPKLKLPKARLHSPIHQISIGKDWNDVHLYCLSPWVMKIIMNKVHLKDLAKEVLPLLIESQFKGVKACLGIEKQNLNIGDDEEEKKDTNADDERVQVLTQLLAAAPFAKNPDTVPLGNGTIVGSEDYMNSSNKFDEDDDTKDYPFTVLANTLSHTSSKLTLRASNVSSYSYACREVLSHAVKAKSAAASTTIKLSLPSDASFDTKSGSVILQNCTLGEKVQIKSSTIGKNVTVGKRCRLNNVVVMDDVKIGENCILQNSVISKGCTIEDNCNLNDCQLGPNFILPHGTKGKGESYVEEDNIQ